jgi:hypothetical protein
MRVLTLMGALAQEPSNVDAMRRLNFRVEVNDAD